MPRDNANKFIGTDHSAPIWYATRSPQKEQSQEIERPTEGEVNSSSIEFGNKAAREMAVDVWLFGLLSTLSEERPLKLHLTNDATPMDVLGALENQFGSEVLSQIKDPVSGILPCCRIFVDGESFEDVHAPIAANQDTASIELIVMKGFEGG